MSRPRGIRRLIPTQVLSCTYAPPQWRSLTRVASFKRPSRPCLLDEAPRIIPRPFSIIQKEEPFFFTWLSPSVQTALPHCLKVPSSGFGYPLDGVSTSNLGSFLNSPCSWASLSRALFQPRSRFCVSAETSARAFSIQTDRLGSDAPAA